MRDDLPARRCSTRTPTSRWRGRPRPEPKVFLPTSSSARASTWYDATYFAHATAERAARREEHQLPRGRRRRRPGPRRARRRPRSWSSCATRSQRAVSNWRFSTEHGLEDRPLDAGADENLDGPRDVGPAATSVSPFAYLERGRYAELPRAVARRVPRPLHVQFLEDLLADPDADRRPLRLARVSTPSPARRPGAAGQRERGEAPPTRRRRLRARTRVTTTPSSDRRARPRCSARPCRGRDSPPRAR